MTFLANRPAEATRRAVLAAGAGAALGGLAEATAAPEIIDIHPHVVSDDMRRYPPRPYGGLQSDWSKERPLPFEQLVAEMKTAGISKAAVVQVSTFYGVDNTYLLESVAKDPKRFTAVCTIDSLAPDAVSVLQGLVRRGCGGLRIFTGGAAASNPAALDDPRSYPLWEYLQRIGMSVCVQTTPDGFDKLRNLLQRFPRTNVILDHSGRPDLKDGPPYAAAKPLFDLAAYPNLYLKITPRTFEWSRAGRASPDTFFPRLVAAYGANRLAFGSNLPSEEGPMIRLVAEANACFAALTAAERAMIFAGTAKRLYPSLA